MLSSYLWVSFESILNAYRFNGKLFSEFLISSHLRYMSVTFHSPPIDSMFLVFMYLFQDFPINQSS